MPCRMLRFCPRCLETQHVTTRENCGVCGTALQPLLDQEGALSRSFLTARGTCCETGCRNCPYPDDVAGGACGAASKTCGKCGRAFLCQSGGCWCEEVKMSAETLRWLSRAYDDCLCPVCLGEFAAV